MWLKDQQPKALGAFFPVKKEPAIWPVLDEYAKNHPLYLPQFNAQKKQYQWARYWQAMQVDPLGIPEPVFNQGEVQETIQFDHCLVPALGIDSMGNRLGWGYGYFDRLLSDQIPHRMGVVFDQQWCAQAIPVDPWDVTLTHVITQSGVRVL